MRVHPDGGLYSGDTLSFQIQAHNGGRTDLARVPLVVDWGFGRADGNISSLPRGGAGSAELLWVWDTTTLIGTHSVTVTVDPLNHTGDPDPGNNRAVIQIDLAAGRPADEIGARWQISRNACCILHTISGTAAARDIDTLMRLANEAMAHDEARLGVTRKDRLDVYLVDRVLGQGGFAGDAITISYLDRNYAGGGLPEVFRHEGVHLLDRQITQGERPVMLAEGFAVYITGGHFKIEPLQQRAAALLQLDGAYIPLRRLADHFYPSQHETGYLEAGAFIDYLVQRDGYDRFIRLYGNLQRQKGEDDAALIDRSLRAVYGAGLDALEGEWLAYLRTVDPGDQRRDLANTLAFYDTVRRYQRTLDPSAYFEEAWIPDIRQAESRELVADYMRHPRAAENIALEAMLVAADEAFSARDYSRSETLLASVNAVLDAGLVFADPIAAGYMNIVRAALAASYEPQRITLDGDRAEVLATRGGSSTLMSLSAIAQDAAWSFQLSR